MKLLYVQAQVAFINQPSVKMFFFKCQKQINSNKLQELQKIQSRTNEFLRPIIRLEFTLP